MVTKVRELAREEAKPPRPHIHYWLIESAHGPTSRGVCKYCGAVQEFRNSWFNMTPSKKTLVLKETSKEESEAEPEEIELKEVEEVELDESEATV